MANKNTIQDWRFTPIKTTRKFRDNLAGTQIERLWVIGLAGKYKTLMYWLCECECGDHVFISTGQLTRTDKRRTRSCGCASKQPKSHGRSGTRVHHIWCLMRERCLSPNNHSYAGYGGAGITICARWLESFENFFEDMGEPPTPEHSIDRWPDKQGNYEPANTRWATKKEQARNTRSNTMITFRNETHCLAEWAEIIGIGQNTLSWRLVHHWTVERALTTPVGNAYHS